YIAMNKALDAGAQYFDLRFDVTFRSPQDIPAGGTFANMTMQIENSNDPVQVTPPTFFYDFSTPSQTLTFSSPLTAWNLPKQGNVAGFYRFDIGVNGDWGSAAAKFYIDNMRLVQTAPVPLLKLRVNRATGAATIQNNSGAPISMDYYAITSSVPGDTNNDK